MHGREGIQWMCFEEGIRTLKAAAKEAGVMVEANTKSAEEEEVKMLKEENKKLKEMVKKLGKALKAKADNEEVQSDITEDTNIFEGVVDLSNLTTNDLEELDLGDDDEVQKFKEALAKP